MTNASFSPINTKLPDFVMLIPRRKVGRRKSAGAHVIIGSRMMTFMGCTEDGLFEAYMTIEQIKQMRDGLRRSEKTMTHKLLMWAVKRYELR